MFCIKSNFTQAIQNLEVVLKRQDQVKLSFPDLTKVAHVFVGFLIRLRNKEECIWTIWTREWLVALEMNLLNSYRTLKLHQSGRGQFTLSFANLMKAMHIFDRLLTWLQSDEQWNWTIWIRDERRSQNDHRRSLIDDRRKDKAIVTEGK